RLHHLRHCDLALEDVADMTNAAVHNVRAATESATAADEFRNHIGGEWTRSARDKTFDNPNPACTSDIVGRFQASTASHASRAVAAATAAFEGWKRMPVSKRAAILNRAADLLDANIERNAREMTREMGKSVALARDEFSRSAQTLRFYAVEGQS